MESKIPCSAGHQSSNVQSPGVSSLLQSLDRAKKYMDDELRLAPLDAQLVMPGGFDITYREAALAFVQIAQASRTVDSNAELGRIAAMIVHNHLSS